MNFSNANTKWKYNDVPEIYITPESLSNYKYSNYKIYWELFPYAHYKKYINIQYKYI